MNNNIQKECALITGGTSNLAGPAGVFYLSLKSMSPNLWNSSDKYFMTSSELNSDNQRALEKMGVIVEEFDTNSLKVNNPSKYFRYFTIGILSKFQAFLKADDYFQSIWFDSDQLNTRDLTDIVCTCKKNDFFITGSDVVGGNGFSNFSKFPSNLLKYLESNPCDFNLPLITGNFFGITDINQSWPEKLRGKMIHSHALELYEKLQSDIYGGEQGIIYILIQKYFEKIKRLNSELFTPHPKEWPIDNLLKVELSSRPYFIHAYSQPKFWNGLDYPLFDHYYDSWLRLGGKPFLQKMKLVNILKRVGNKFK